MDIKPVEKRTGMIRTGFLRGPAREEFDHTGPPSACPNGLPFPCLTDFSGALSLSIMLTRQNDRTHNNPANSGNNNPPAPLRVF